jgi:hypothetical protein
METAIEPKVLLALESDMEDIRPTLLTLTRQVLAQGISKYPVYIAGLAPIAIGKPFISAEIALTQFDYNASVLEEFVAKGLVLRERLPEFKAAFGDPEEKACIFVALPDSSGFVFLPLNA